MIAHEVKVRVRYAETDKMGYVYYGNYATYFEVARVETFRAMGMSYKSMEEQGVMMPVLEFKTKYIKPAFYDDELTLKIEIREKPGVRITFFYEVYNEKNTLLTIAETTLAFIDGTTYRPCLPPTDFQEILNRSFS